MSAENLIKLLAVAFNAKQLYPDPVNVPAFTQAVEKLAEIGDENLVVEVTVDGFRDGSGEIALDHGAASRLSHLLFARQIATLGLVGRPTPSEVVEFFNELEAEAGDGDLDLATRVDLAGVSALRVRMREVLDEREDQDEEEEEGIARHPDVEELFDDDSVQRIADRVGSSTTLAEASELFFGLFLNAHSQLGDHDPAGLERVVQTFVDAFFRLDNVFQVHIFEVALMRRTEMSIEMFLDQFSADEFETFASQAEDSVLPLLLDYAAAVAEHVGEGLETSPSGGGGGDDDSRGAVASSVGQHLAEFLKFESPQAEAMQSISAEIAGLDDDPMAGPRLFAELLLVEARQDRLARLLRVWAGRSSRAIRQRSFDLALSWLAVVSEKTDLDSRLVDEAYRQVVTDEVFDIVTGEDAPGRAELLEALSARAGTRVLEALALEEDPGRRRALVDVVAEIARVDLRAILPGLSDERWYVVRNLATALGRSGRRAAAEPLSRLLREHGDHRVRIEAARALLPCVGDDAVDYLVAALSDEHARVRATVAELLRALDDHIVIAALASGVRDEARPVEVRVAMIEALGAQAGEGAKQILVGFAESKAGLSSTARAMRTAARNALRSSHA